jgi:hypothetical protein
MDKWKSTVCCLSSMRLQNKSLRGHKWKLRVHVINLDIIEVTERNSEGEHASKMYRLVAEVYQCNYHNSLPSPSSYLLKYTTFRRLDLVHAHLCSGATLTSVLYYRCHHYHYQKKKKRLFCDRRSVGQSILVSGTHLGSMTTFLLLLDICGPHVVASPL